MWLPRREGRTSRPIFQTRPGRQGGFQKIRHHIAKGHAILILRFLGGEIVQCRLILAKLVDQSRLPHPTSSVDDNEGGLFSAVFPFQDFPFGLAIDKATHETSQLERLMLALHASMLSKELEDYAAKHYVAVHNVSLRYQPPSAFCPIGRSNTHHQSLLESAKCSASSMNFTTRSLRLSAR